MEALEPYRVPQPEQSPPPMKYLTPPQGRPDAYDVALEVSINGTTVCKYVLCFLDNSL